MNLLRRAGRAIANSRAGRAVQRAFNRATGRVGGGLPSPNMVGGGH